jgi:tripartite-type tricarboxylate transporter receptor subunit TctC
MRASFGLKTIAAVFGAALLIAPALTQSAAAAESASSFPSKPVRLIVTFGPGGPTDILARDIAQKLSETWGQPVIVENRPGAGGTIGTAYVAKAAPDGYTLVESSLGPMASAPYVYQSLPYDPLKDLKPITLVATSYLFLAINPATPAKTVQELIALAKADPGKLTAASSGVATPSHLAEAAFALAAGIKLTHIPYKGGAESVGSVVAGQTTMALETPSPIVPQVKAGKLRALMVLGPTRSSQLPDVPTSAEAGLPGLVAGSWYGFHAPAGTPQEIVDKIHDAIVKIVQTPEMKARIATLGAEATTDTPAQFQQFVQEDMKRWQKVVKEADIKLD